MKIPTRLLVTTVALLAGSIVAHAAIATAPRSDPSVRLEELDEVVVAGTRLWELRAAVIKAQDLLVARYNQLNRDDDFDINCVTNAPTGTRFLRRYCLTRLQEREEQNDAIAIIDWQTDMILDPNKPGAITSEIHTNANQPNPQTQMHLAERSEDYRKNLIQLMQDHPELRRLARQQAEARRAYETAIRQRNKKAKSSPAM
jgi:hypothetical protein